MPKINFGLPPNIDEIRKHLQPGRGTVYTYGDTIYFPRPQSITPDLMVHEEVHIRQQEKGGPEKWWSRYFVDQQFRLDQELEAYRAQYQYMLANMNRAVRRKRLKDIASDLSGPMYGKLISKATAIELIQGQ